MNLEDLDRRIRRMETLVNSLCITNFMTDHKDGDERVRNKAVSHINMQAQQAKDEFNTNEKHFDLYLKIKQMQEEMLLLEQDYPHLRNPNA